MDIKIFVRHCNFSANSAGKPRPKWFTRELCFNNLKETAQGSEITIMFDGSPNEKHFLYNNTSDKIVCKNAGNDGASFLNLLEYVYKLELPEDTILYFLEDDYYHRKGWPEILREAFTYMDVDYVTLYDHPDKYSENYSTLKSSLFVTPNVHWRTTPSTTNTYAMKNSTFRKHYDIHREFCDLSRGHTFDHDKFLKLWREGSNLISCIPGYANNCEIGVMSPVINWEKEIL
jgi:hypothetical protein